MIKSILLFIALVLNQISYSQTKSILFFDSNKSELTVPSVRLLDSLVSLLKDKGDFQIVINGYCDNTGNEDWNQKLSEQRSKNIFNYFKNKNLNTENISFKGFSSIAPIAKNNTEIGKSKNRRAEILITILDTSPLVQEKSPPLVQEKIDTKPFEQEPGTTLIKNRSLETNSDIENLEVGNILTLKNLNFEGGTAILLKESEPSLKMLLKLLKEHVTLEIEIEGHVCCANDMQLSIERALTVLEYLVNNGIDEKRLKYAGHSFNNPVASEKTEEGRKQNRRVEIMILKQ